MRLVIALLFAHPLIAQTNPLAGNSAAIDVGKGNFRLYCSYCHGIHAQGGRGPDLTRGSFAAGETDADLFRVISRGVEGTEMAAYAERFDETMIWRLVAFIRAVEHHTTGAISGNVDHGREIFDGKGRCRGCHSVADKGGVIGPSLTFVGRQRSIEYLREKLLTPSAFVTSGYTTVAVILPDGRTLTGVEKGFDDFSVQFLDTAGKFHSYRKEEVKSMERRNLSLMPATYSKDLSPSEQTDLLAYLASLRGEK